MFRLRLLVGLPSVFILFAGCTGISGARSGHLKPQVDFSLQRVAFQVGETTIHAQVRQFGSGALTMVNVHDDEQASVDAAVVVLEKRGGRLIELTHSGKRRVVFQLAGRDYSFDPNRIFSQTGVRKTVSGDEGEVPDAAHAAVTRFAREFVEYFGLDRAPVFVTLHNNGDGGLSIHSYAPGGEWEADTDELYANPGADPDDFYFVTHGSFFDTLKTAGFNVILQDNRIKRDDGSLSVFAGRRSIPYINVEAEPGHQAEQIRMIETAFEIISTSGHGLHRDSLTTE
jgi:hypothetical protein